MYFRKGNNVKFLELKDNKQPLTKFNILHDSYDHLRNAGLMLNEKVVVIDFDGDNKCEEKIIKFFSECFPTLKIKTNRGYHLYYSVPENCVIHNNSDAICVGGFQIDYKTGKNSYVIVKQHGVERVRNKPLSLIDLPPLPHFLFPIKYSGNISGMRKGDGRNNALFKHLCLVKEQTNLNIEDVAEFINDLIFSDSLGQRELESLVNSVDSRTTTKICTNEQQTNKNGNKKFKLIDFAKKIVQDLKITIYDGKIYFWDGHKFVCNDFSLLKLVNSKHELSKNQDQELLHQLKKLGEYIPPLVKYNRILLKNGTLVNGELVDDDICDFTPFSLDVEYKEDVYDAVVDNFLNEISCNDNKLRLFLEEIIGHVLMIESFPQKIFFLVGSGKNGKSTFVNMLRNFVQSLTSEISLDRFNDDTSLMHLSGKLLNISDDINPEYIEQSGKLKLMSAGNSIDIRPIYSSPISLKNTATFILTANELPVFKDKTNGLYRRLVIVPFDYTVTTKKNKLDSLLSTDNAKSYLLKLALDGVKRIRENNYEMSDVPKINETIEEYKKETDSLYDFLQNIGEISGLWFTDVFAKYERFCYDNFHESLVRNVFSRKLKNYGYCTGKQERVAVSFKNRTGRDKRILKR